MTKVYLVNGLINVVRVMGYPTINTIRKNKAGDKIDVSLSIPHIFNNNGELNYLATWYRDIRESIKSRKKLEFQENIFKNVNDAIITTDIDFRIIDQNENIKYVSANISLFYHINEPYLQGVYIDNTEKIQIKEKQKALAVDSIYINEKNQLIEELRLVCEDLSKIYDINDIDKKSTHLSLINTSIPKRLGK
jgi:hypothetical protein